MSQSTKDAEGLKLFEIASQTGSKLVYFMTAGALAVVAFSVQTAPSRPVQYSVFLLVATWVALLLSAFAGFRWLLADWNQARVNYKKTMVLANIERLQEMVNSGVSIAMYAKTGATLPPEDIIPKLQADLHGIISQSEADNDGSHRAFVWQEVLVIGGLLMYAAFYVWNVLVVAE